MLINFLGALANLTSLVLWLPQARTTWRNRSNPEALKGVNLLTQIIVAINTVLWCIVGLLTQNGWLAMGTVVILPLAVWTIILKTRASSIELSKNTEDL
jgi:uncharacterized protein with PQ loop repeat